MPCMHLKLSCTFLGYITELSPCKRCRYMCQGISQELRGPFGESNTYCCTCSSLAVHLSIRWQSPLDHEVTPCAFLLPPYWHRNKSLNDSSISLEPDVIWIVLLAVLEGALAKSARVSRRDSQILTLRYHRIYLCAVPRRIVHYVYGSLSLFELAIVCA